MSGYAADVAALARCRVAPLRERLVRRAERRLRVVDGGVGHLDERLTGRRVLDLDGRALAAVPPLAADVELRLDRVEDGLLCRCRGHVATLPSATRRPHVETVSVPSSLMATSME